MKTRLNVIPIAVSAIESEAQAIKNLSKKIDKQFSHAVDLIIRSKGRVIATGIGKSAIIAQKLVATLNSTGTPAAFMHAADAIHGDLGIILKNDVVVCLSKSGETPEIKVLLPIIRNNGNKIIAIVSNTKSWLARNADYVLNASVENEACPNNLAPTTSTTVQLVLCDALSICLLQLRGFSKDDFAKIHPGGSLGKKLYMRVKDLYNNTNPPKVLLNDNLRKVIWEISSKRMGATAVVNKNNRISGIVTDGDIRRMLEKGLDINKVVAKDIMTSSPRTISPDELAINAFYLMEKNNITQLPACSEGIYKGMLHLHDILKEGIV